MTTATRTLPPHGTPSRARGSRYSGIPRCYCQPCRVAERAYTKHRNYLASTGRSVLVDVAPARTHLRYLTDNGDALTVLAEQLDCPRGTLASVLNGPRKRINRTLANQILIIRPGHASAGNRSVPAVGATRKIRALIALGHALRTISLAAGMENTTASNLLNGKPETIHYELAQRVHKGYRALCSTPGTHTRSLRRAQREGWAPPAAWDDEQIDDPNAAPDWTGHCGTDRGWWMHTSLKLPMCQACKDAHVQWKAERRHLSREEFMSATFLARAAAASRGPGIAEDGRELMRLGHTPEQAAARLGITRDYLKQELGRHPEKPREQAAA